MSLVFGHWLWALGYDPTLPSLDRQPSTSTSQTEQASISTASFIPEPVEPEPEQAEQSEPEPEQAEQPEPEPEQAEQPEPEPAEPEQAQSIPDIPLRSSKRPSSSYSEDVEPSDVEPFPLIVEPPSPVSSWTDTLCDIMEPLTLAPIQDVSHDPEEKPAASHVEAAVGTPLSSPAIEASGTKRRFSLSTPSRSNSPADPRLGTVDATSVLATPSIQEETSEQEAAITVTATSEEATETPMTATTYTVATNVDALELDDATETAATESVQEPQPSLPGPDLASELPTPSVPTPSGSAVGNPLDAVKTAQPLQTFTMRQVAQHNSPRDLWLVIGEEVYDCTEFAATHPGGAKILNGIAGKDATKKFDKYHRRAILDRYRPKLQVGFLDSDPADSVTARKGFLGKLGFGGKGRPRAPYGFARRGTM